MLGRIMPALAIREADPSKQDDKGTAIVAVSVVFTTIAFTTTCLRLWVRKGRRAIGADDYTITAAMCLTIVEAALTIQATTHGKGKRGKYLSKGDTEYINMYSWYAQHVLFAAMALVKISVCLLVTRIKNSTAMKWLTGVVIAVLCTSALECSIVLLAQCRPISAHWRPVPGACWPPEVRIYSIYVQAGMLYVQSVILLILTITSRIFNHYGSHMLAASNRHNVEYSITLPQEVIHFGFDGHGISLHSLLRRPSQIPQRKSTRSRL